MEAAAGSLVKCLIKAAGGQLKYAWFYDTYIKDLNDGLTELKSAKDRRQEEVGRAHRNAEEIYVEVNEWLDRVKEITEQATEVMEKHNKSKKGCFPIKVIPNLSARFRIARRAEGNKQEIDRLKQKNNFFLSVSHPRAPTGIVTGNYEGPEYWIAPSRASLLEEISKALLDPSIRIVGVWGAPGVGKSIFLKQLEKQVQERKLNYDFDAVTIAIVSRSPNWEKVQDDLGSSLGLKMEENSMVQKAEHLRRRLSQGDRVLIILDDIWEKIDLENLGVPFDKQPRIKLLVTSRSEQVLRGKMDSEHNFHLEPLKQSEPVDLFKHILGHRAQEDVTLVNQLASECAGLPVLISPLATSLKSLDLSAWVETLSKLRDSNKLGIETILDESMNFKDSEETKSLFLLCGQIGFQIIPINYLVILGMGLGLLKGDYTMQEVREKIRVVLDNLKASCLLEAYGKDYVKLHDLMGDTARSIASKTGTSIVIRNSNALKACSEEELKNCKTISMPYPDVIDELPIELPCPELDMLVVSIYANNSHLQISDAFFEKTTKLKVLHLSGIPFNFLPSSIQFLKELHTLALDNVTTKDLKIIGKLKTLQVLILGGLGISRILQEIGELKNLRCLDLRGCLGLEAIEPNVLGRLVNMEELHLPQDFDKWDVAGNASLAELNNMPRLSTLTVCVPNVASLTNDMPFQQLVRYNICVGKVKFMENFSEERILKLTLEPSSNKFLLKELLQTTLKRTQDLYVGGWNEFEESITGLSKEGFPELKHIYVQCSATVQYIVHSKHTKAVPILESLSLFCLTDLEKIFQGDLPPKSFNSLKVIKIQACDKLRNLFSSASMDGLPNLEEIEVSDCDIIKEIITYTGNKMGSVNDNGVLVKEKFELLKLKHMHKIKLDNLRNFSSFCSEGNWEVVQDDGGSLSNFIDGRQVSLPCLESLTLSELPNLTKVSHSQYPVQLHLLKSLELSKCKSLLYAIDFSLLLQLRDLESLIIDGCESMETVFNLEDLDDACVYVLNQRLQINLRLSNLPKLKALWDKNPRKILQIFKLNKLEVSSCDGLKNLSSSSIANASHISIDSCMTMEEVFLLHENENDHHQETVDGVIFPWLTYLSVSNMEILETFSHGNHNYQFPSLTSLTIASCPKMKTVVYAKHEKDETTTCEDATADAPFFNTKDVLPSLETLVLHSLKSMKSLWDGNLSKSSFCSLKSIEIKECERVQTIFPSHLAERMLNLKKVEVESCDQLEVLFEYEHEKLTMYSELQEIRLLKLKSLTHLTMMMKDHLSQEASALTFPSMRDVLVKECNSLLCLFPDATARSLSELANMCISSCGDLKEVVSFDGEEGNMASTEPMRFKNLTSLQLENLDNLVHFCSGQYELYFPFLKKLLIVGCNQLKAFVSRPNLVGLEEQSQNINSTNNKEVGCSPLFDEKVVCPNLQELQITKLALKEIWPRNEPTSFHVDLKILSIEECDRLSIIIPPLMLPNLHHLESLSIRSCNSAEVIFKLEKPSSRKQKILGVKSTIEMLKHLRQLTLSNCESVEHVVARGDKDHAREPYYNKVIIPHLSSLKLSELRSLSSFCDKNQEVELPLLAELQINGCDAVEVLVADSNQQCKPLLLTEKIEFPKMKSMEISSMQKLTELWHIGSHSERSSQAFCKLKLLKVTGCDNLLTVFPSKMISSFQNTEQLFVMSCKSLENIFEFPDPGSESNKSDDVVQTTFALRTLTLEDLPQVKHVWNVEDTRWVYPSFDKLYFVRVAWCQRLRHLFPASIARCLPQLNRFHIIHCEEMKEIVWEGESAHHQSISIPLPESTNLEWPLLEVMSLEKCPGAKIFTSVQQKVSIPRLKGVRTSVSTLENWQLLDEVHANPKWLYLVDIENSAWVESIPWLLLLERFPDLRELAIWSSDCKEIFPSDIEKDGGIVSYKSGFADIAEILSIRKCHHLSFFSRSSALFRHLKVLKVEECNGLLYLISASAARSLVQLTSLVINGCNNLQVVVTYDYDENGIVKNGVKDDADMISFPQLKHLELANLPMLQSFSFTSYKFNFPTWETILLSNLPVMRVFCEGDFTTPNKNIITRFLRTFCENKFPQESKT